MRKNLDAAHRAEFEILCCCARNRLDPPDRERLETLFAGPVDSTRLLPLAAQHGMVPLLRKHSEALGAGWVPGGFHAQLQEDARQATWHSLLLTAELLRLSEVLRDRAIPAIFYKGPVLAVRAFGDASLRQCADLDLVVPQEHMRAVFEAMDALGYDSRLPVDPVSPSAAQKFPGEYVFAHPRRRTLVEFHTEFTLRHFPSPPNLGEMMGRSGPVVVKGREVPAFALEDDLLMLAVHGAKDFWSRLIWVADVAELARQLPAASWPDLFRRARGLEIARMVKLALILGRQLLAVPLPGAVEGELESDRVAQRLALALRKQMTEDGSSQDGLLWRSAYRVRMRENLGDGIRYWMRLSTTPAEEDWGLVHLPRPVSRAYVFLRPLRLWKKYGLGKRAGRGHRP